MSQQTTALDKARKQIDEIDDQLVRLLNERAAAAERVGAAKGGAPKLNVAREAEVLRRVEALSQGPLPETTLKAVFREIISGCLSLQQPLRVSYLGPQGTFSEEAAQQRFGAMAELLQCASLHEALRLAETDSANVAVLPVENSTEGSVGQTLDLLLTTSLTICDEVQLPIHHYLIGNAAALKDVTEVAAHPQALAQCRAWLSTHVSHATQTPVASNGEAARRAAADKTCAAVASKRAADIHGLKILAGNIEDDPANSTRFLVLGAQGTRPTAADKTSLACSVANTPGALAGILAIFSAHNLNMVKLESRPARSHAWEYVFYIDIEGHQLNAPVATALQALKQQATFVKVLGSYPKAV